MTGLQGWWPLQDESAQDYSGNGNGGTLNGTIYTGVYGVSGISAFNFTSSSNVELNTNYMVSSPPYSVAAWVNMDSNTSGQTVVHYSRERWSLNYESYRSDGFEFRIFDGNNSVVVSSAVTKTDEWVHLVGVHTGSFIQIYVNGELQGVTQASANSTSSSEGSDIGRNDVDGNDFIGSICDVRTYSRVLSPQEIALLYEQGAQAAPPVDGVARYEFEGDVTDSWGSNDGTNNGASFVDGYYGQAAKFVRSESDNITASTLSPSETDTGFTITGWINFDSANFGNTQTLVVQSDGYNKLSHQRHGGNNIEFTVSGGGTSAGYDGISPNRWYHVTGVYNGSEAFLYVDGVKRDDYSPSSPSDSDSLYYIGNNGSGGTYFDGLLDDLRFYPYALSSRQVSALYHGWSDLARPTTDGLVAHYKLNGDASDSAGSNDGTNNGVTFERGVRGQGGKFESSNSDYYSIPISTNSSVSSLSYSVWVYSNDTSIFACVISSQESGSNEFSLRQDQNGTMAWFSYDGSTNGFNGTGPSIPQNEWTHFVGTYDSDDGYALYKNGQLTNKTSDTTLATNSQSENIGRRGGTGDLYWDGLIDDVRIYDRALEPWEIHELYRYGTRGRDLREKLVNA